MNLVSINKNKCCIEIMLRTVKHPQWAGINKNKCCIEIRDNVQWLVDYYR